jgi:pimeloyl-ACP methyl ester carboxylesterase
LPVAEANGVELYYELNGSRGDPMVLVHGSWTDHSNWNLVVSGLSERFRVLTYDRRGHGMSAKPHTQGSGEEDAMDLSALLARLGLSPAHVVGNSFGGSIALKLAVMHPGSFRSLVAHEPPLFGLLADEPSVQKAMAEGRMKRERVAQTLESGDRAGAARLFVESLAFGPGVWERMSPQGKERMVANADAWLDETRDRSGQSVDLDALKRFDKPALLTYGGKGIPGARLIVERLARAIPVCRVEGYPDLGHSPHTSDPMGFVRTVTEFADSSEQAI